jgi:cytosine/adenosine deaminase-related metal-dependent hydrolase
VIHYRADWLLPIADAPVAGGVVSLERGRIAAVGTARDGDVVDLGRAVILPGLVNAHTHLELSYLHQVIPPSPQFGQWVRTVMATRQQYPDPADSRIVEPARRAIEAARAAGTALVGDISNTLVTVPLLREAALPAQVFYELLGFTEPDPVGRVRAARARMNEVAGVSAGVPARPEALAKAGDIRISLAPHAPYSVSAALFQAIRADLDAHPDAVSSVHLGEPPDEIELLRHGTGAIRTVLEDLGRWPSDWRPPGVSPVEYLTGLGVLDSRMLVVHGVQFDGEDLTTLRTIGATLVACPRSNAYVGVGPPPLEVFYAMDVDVAFGTDSLASVDDLNLFAELAEARRLAPRVRARRLLESATLTGARALGRERDFGSIEVGKRAALITVRLPDGVTDVEEYLVGGFGTDAIMWLDAGR